MVYRLYIGNIPFSTEADDLVSFFEENGFTVRNPKIPLNRETGRPRGFAFLDVESEADQMAAINTLNGTMFGGREMRVSPAVEKERSAPWGNGESSRPEGSSKPEGSSRPGISRGKSDHRRTSPRSSRKDSDSADYDW